MSKGRGGGGKQTKKGYSFFFECFVVVFFVLFKCFCFLCFVFFSFLGKILLKVFCVLYVFCFVLGGGVVKRRGVIVSYLA